MSSAILENLLAKIQSKNIDNLEIENIFNVKILDEILHSLKLKKSRY